MSEIKPGPRPNRPLDSWKEIAGFFDKQVRTVQRWEKEEGMPVHRHAHGRQSSVFAYPQELEEWWRGRGPDAASNSKVSRRALGGGIACLILLAAAALAVGHLRRPSLQPPPPHPGKPQATFYGPASGAQLRLSRAGDFNGDGWADLAFSAAGNRRTYLVFGSDAPLASGSIEEIAETTIQASLAGQWGNTLAGDFNGDGLSDLIIAHMLDEKEGYSATGSSYLLFGREKWPARLSLPDDADAELNFDWAPDARLSPCLQGGRPSDLNQDGLDDLILSAPEYGMGGEKSVGGVFVLFGRRSWPPALEVASQADLSILGSLMGEGVGGPCSIGDSNGDGHLDLSVHANHETLWGLRQGRGRFHLFFGRESWPSGLSTQSEADLTIGGDVPASDWSASLLADVNGDSLSDLVMARHRRSRSNQSPGEVRIWLGGRPLPGSYPEGGAEIVLRGEQAGSSFGQSLAAEDLDGDGCQDLLISEPSTGIIRLLWGRPEWRVGQPAGSATALALITAERSAGEGNLEIADLDGDGLAELALAAPGAAAGIAEQAGRAWVYRLYKPLAIDVRPGQVPDVILSGRGVTAIHIKAAENSIESLRPQSIRLHGAAPLKVTQDGHDGDASGSYLAYFDNSLIDLKPGRHRVMVRARTRNGLPAAGTASVEVRP